jgi:hypothetical protein
VIVVQTNTDASKRRFLRGFRPPNELTFNELIGDTKVGVRMALDRTVVLLQNDSARQICPDGAGFWVEHI